MGVSPNEERNVEIIRRREELGQLPRQIAMEMGLSKGVVIGITNRAGCSEPGFSRECLLRGSDLPQSKLTEMKVFAIRHHFPEVGAAPLAAEFGVSTSTIHDVVTRRTWKHVQ